MSPKFQKLAFVGVVCASLVAVDMFYFDGGHTSGSGFTFKKKSTVDSTHFAGGNGAAGTAKETTYRHTENQLNGALNGGLPSGRVPLPAMSINDEVPKHVKFLKSEELQVQSDQLVVKAKPGSDFAKNLKLGKGKLEEYLAERTGSDFKVVRSGNDFAVLKVIYKSNEYGSKENEFSKVKKAIAATGIAGFEEDLIIRPTYEVNDDRYSEQWYLSRVSKGGSNASVAWNKALGELGSGNRVTIAVVDTGITSHPDLSANVISGFDFISDSLRSLDGDGWDSDPSDHGDGVNSTESNDVNSSFNGCAVRNSSWHGTHVAGIAAAVGNNGSGIIGVAPRAQILPVRVLGKCGGYLSDVAEGIRWAAGLPVDGAPVNTNPAKIINLSLGGMGTCGSYMQSAITDANRSGSVVVVAAGNSGVDAREFTPANCSGVVVVGAVGQSGDRAYYSNYGSRITISAPGGDVRDGNTILSSMNSGAFGPGAPTYGFAQGTSMATPVISGAAALAMSANPKIGAASAISLLTKTAQKFETGSLCFTQKNCGIGIVDIGAAVGGAETNMPDVAVAKFSIDTAVIVPNVAFEAMVTLVNMGSLPTATGNGGKVEIYLSTVTGENKLKIGDVNIEDIGVLQSRGSKVIKIQNLMIGSKSAFSQLEPGQYGISAAFNSGDWDVNKTNNFSRLLPVEYVMPIMSLSAKMSTNQVPADINFQAAFSDPRVARVAMGGDWKYEWLFSDGTIVKASGQKASLRVTTAGKGKATLTLKHAPSGFNSTASVDYETINPLPSVISFTESASNDFLRAPVTFKFTPTISIGHPNDRLSSISWDINNGEMTSNRTNAIVTLGAGNHVIRSRATTKMGFNTDFEKVIAVRENVAPDCRIDYSRPIGDAVIIFNADCKDSDGIIKGIRWALNGRTTSTPMRSPYSLRIQPPKGSGNLTVKIIVMDDAKATGEAQVTVAY